MVPEHSRGRLHSAHGRNSAGYLALRCQVRVNTLKVSTKIPTPLLLGKKNPENLSFLQCSSLAPSPVPFPEHGRWIGMVSQTFDTFGRGYFSGIKIEAYIPLAIKISISSQSTPRTSPKHYPCHCWAVQLILPPDALPSSFPIQKQPCFLGNGKDFAIPPNMLAIM